jgi:hypothetical protein
MARVLVNGGAEDSGHPAKTWGELLEALDRRCETRGEVMTVVRCDGVDQPTFRDASFGGQPLPGFELVEVEAVKPRELLLSTLDEAALALDALASAAQRLGVAYRGFDVSAANRELAEFAQSLVSLVVITNTVASAVSADLAQVGEGGRSSVNVIDELSTQTEALISAQRVGDWISVADTIEYDIGLTLGRWPAVLASLRGSVPTS